MLGKYRKKRDQNSPAPPAQEFREFKERYLSASRKAAHADELLDIFPQIPESVGETEEALESSEEIPEEIPEDSEEFPHGVVVGIGVDVGVVKKQTTDMSIPAESHPKAAPPGTLAPGIRTPQAEESRPRHMEAK